MAQPDLPTLEAVLGTDRYVGDTRTHGEGAEGKLPITEEMLLNEPSGNLFALDQIGTSPASRIVEFDGSTGVYIRTIATNLVFPFDLGVGPNGNVFATQLQAFGAPADVTEYDPVSGALVGSYDTPNSTFGIGLDFNPASGRLLASMRNPDGFAEFAVGGGYLNTYLTAGFQPNKIAFKVPEPATLGLLLVSLILAGRRH